jgi:hypothetical protein
MKTNCNFEYNIEPALLKIYSKIVITIKGNNLHRNLWKSRLNTKENMVHIDSALVLGLLVPVGMALSSILGKAMLELRLFLVCYQFTSK